MALDFPNAPTNGQSFTAPNGVTWTWDGVKWLNGTGVATYAPIGSPAFTGDPTAPTPAYGDNDTSVATTAFVQAATAPMTHNVGRNLLHNSMFNVAQRGTGGFNATTIAQYTADRWAFIIGAAGDTFSVQIVQHSDGNRTQIGDEQAASFLSVSVIGGAAAGNACELFQRIENVRRLAGKTVTVSFWANAAPALSIGVNLTQSFGTGGSPSADVVVGGQARVLSATWGRYSVTFTVPSVVGKTLGTTAGTDFTSLEFWLSAGSSYAVRAGIGVQSGTINIWGVQLEIGSVATPLDKPDPQQDLAKCQRFAQLLKASSRGSASGAGAVAGCSLNFPPMRATPTYTVLSVGDNSSNTSGGVLVLDSNHSANFEVISQAAGDFYIHGASYLMSADL